MGENPFPLGEDFSRLAVLCKLPQDLAFRLRSELPFGLDHQIPPAGFLWRRSPAFAGSHPGDM